MLHEKIKNLPDLPGVYRYLDKQGVIIYIGKATNLKSRVTSYFTGAHNLKTQTLVSHIEDIHITVTDTATEALFLENTLIKKHKPKYNILLKDDKTYPFIEITNEEYPRVVVTRKREKHGGRYFGPYSSSEYANTVVQVVNDLYPLVKLANCGKRTPCLYYHTNSCLAPCSFEVDQKEYKQFLNEIIDFLKGNQQRIFSRLEEKMTFLSDQLHFESAALLRDQLTIIKRMNEKQKVMLPNNSFYADMIHVAEKEGVISLSVFFIRNGVLLDTYQQIIESHLSLKDSLREFVERFYLDRNDLPKEVYLPFSLDNTLFSTLGIRTHVPKQGEKKKILDLVRKNAQLALESFFVKRLSQSNVHEQALEQLSDVLRIPLPKRIEMFDNSNIQGASAVSAMVCFIDGLPAKNEYRKFKVKTVEGSDDVGTMREIITRRYLRVLREGSLLPDLIVIDGGLAHIRAVEVILSQLNLSHIPLIGVAKDDTHSSSYVVDTQNVVYDFSSHKKGFYLLTRIQDEVHRFAIDFFRKTHSKNTFASILDTIDGVGKTRKTRLLTHFKSISAMKKATVSDFESLGIPKQVALNIVEALQKK